MTLPTPPLYDLVTDDQGKAGLSWSIFFQNLTQGDPGNSWTPTFVSMGGTATPTYTGRYFFISDSLCFFYIKINPNGGNTTSTAATTYCDNFPELIATDGVCFVGTGSGAVQSIGGIRAADRRIYMPAWTALTQDLTVVGLINVGVVV